MISQVLYDELSVAVDQDRILQDVLMSGRTSFKTGGPADCIISPKNEDELISIINIAKKHNQSIFILGNGTNILVRDGGLRGIVISLYEHFNQVDIDEETGIIVLESGALISAVSNYACRAGLSGLEFASGIPGCAGAAVKINAGAYDGQMSDITTEVRVLKDSGDIVSYNNEEMKFDYRTSMISGDDLVLKITIKLEKGDAAKIRSKMVGFSKKRKASQPLNMPSAGSSFKRPDGAYAGVLIEEAGLKGYTVGCAQVSKKHAGFVVNTGKATSKDIEQVIADVEQRVKEHSGYDLVKEIIIIGEE